MAEYLNDIANMRRYCVLCGREYGPQLSNCCTHNSVVAVKRVGLIKTRVLYFTLDGRQLDEHGLALVRDKAVKALGSVGQEPEQHPSECAHEIDHGFSTSEATLTIPTEDEIGSKRPNTGTHLWLVCVILGVPLLGFLLSRGIQTHLDSELRAELRKHFSDVNETVISSVNVRNFCASAPDATSGLCETNRILDLISAVALGAALAGVALLVLIKVAANVTRSSRTSLLYVFKPSLYLTALVLVGLVLVHAAVAVGVIYFGQATLLGRIYMKIIALIVSGAVGGVYLIARSVFLSVKKATTHVFGMSLSREDAPKLWDRVEQIAQQLGALPPEHVVVGLDPNFFVTEAKVACLTGALDGRTLYCSLPLARILSVNEFVAVIAHELGHFKGLDTIFSIKFYPIYAGTISSIASLSSIQGLAALPSLPAIAIFSYFLESFSEAESHISRERELAADLEAAGMTGASAIATALVKVHAFSGLWRVLQNAAAERLQQGKAFVNFSKTYAELASEIAEPALLDELVETRQSHPTDSHPPLAVRLGSLGIKMADVASASLSVSPEDAAVMLIDGAEQYEEELTGAFQTMLAGQLGIDVTSDANN